MKRVDEIFDLLNGAFLHAVRLLFKETWSPLFPSSSIPGFAVKFDVQWKDDVRNTFNRRGGILLEPNKHITLNPLRQVLINCVKALSTLSGSSIQSANLKSLPWASRHGNTMFTVAGVGAEE